MKTITIRGIDENLDRVIKTMSKETQMSINQWIIQMLRRVTNLDKKPTVTEYHDLDQLAGGWTQKEFEQFQKNNQIFENIDEEIWK